MRWLRIATFVLMSLLLWGPACASAAIAVSAEWQILRDPTAELQLDDVRSDELKRLFKPVSLNDVSTTGNNAAVWLHHRLPAGQPAQTLQILAPFLSYLDLYVLQGSHLIDQVHTGSNLPYSSRPLPSHAFLLPLPESGMVQDIYLRLASEQALHPSISLKSAEQLAVTDRTTLLLGLLLGSMAVLLSYNLLRYAYTRASTTLWLAATQICLLSTALSWLGINSYWLGSGYGHQAQLVNISMLLSMFCALLFTARFFAGVGRDQRFITLLYTEACAIALVALLLVLTQELKFTLLVCLIVLVCSLTALVVAIKHWRQGYIPARAFSLSTGLFFCGFAYSVPAQLGYIPLKTDWLAYGLMALCVFCSFILSLALSGRQRHIVRNKFSVRREQATSAAEIKAKGEFLAKISHEIRTPMNGVLGMTELLLGTPLSAKQRDYAQTIHNSGNELLTLINEILDLTKLESGQIELEDVQFDLNALVEDCIDIFRAKAEQQKVELISFIQPQVPRVINGDPSRLRQVLLSLLDNAFKQTLEGEVLVVLTLDKAHDPPRLRIAVQDRGLPLSPRERDALLHAHLHSHELLEASQLGGRLGLIIAPKLVSLMSGEYGIQSSDNQGNTLWLSLPLDASRLEQPLNHLENALRGARVLVVDDNDTCRKVLMQQCTAWGMHVSAVPSGKEALALLRTKAHLQEYFDLVLVDQNMPGMTGLQLASRIKEDANINHDILIIMLTGISNVPSKIIARNAGIKRILAKPVAGYTLKTTLADELAQRSKSNAPIYVPQRTTEPLNLPSDFRILVAEDNTISTKVIRGMLGKLNLHPDTASDGQQALEAIKAQHYDLVLMDCEMPVMDGFTATEQLRIWEQLEKRPRTPVVALTAHILNEHKVRARQAGMDGHMSKPLEMSQLRELVEHWVLERELRRQQRPDPSQIAL